MAFAIIGGTGLYDPSMLDGAEEREVVTPYGRAHLHVGRAGAREVIFLARHGAGHAIPPHRVNYRANLWALRELGAREVLATAAVGSLRDAYAPGQLALIDQFIDFTRGRPSTFYEGDGEGVLHLDVSDPYCPRLRSRLREVADRLGIGLHASATYVCTEGPRFETPAEIRAYALLGGDLVGMTGLPEVVLARELNLCYAAVAMVTNYAAGISPTPLAHSEVVQAMERMSGLLRGLLRGCLEAPEAGRDCRCGEPHEIHGRREADR